MWQTSKENITVKSYTSKGTSGILRNFTKQLLENGIFSARPHKMVHSFS